MASGITKIADVVVPEIFTDYTRQLTEEKARLVQAGVLTTDAFLSGLLAGGGLTYNVPSWQDLDNDADNVSEDNEVTTSTPNKIQTSLRLKNRRTTNSGKSSTDWKTKSRPTSWLTVARLSDAVPLESPSSSIAVDGQGLLIVLQGFLIELEVNPTSLFCFVQIPGDALFSLFADAFIVNLHGSPGM